MAKNTQAQKDARIASKDDGLKVLGGGGTLVTVQICNLHPNGNHGVAEFSTDQIDAFGKPGVSKKRDDFDALCASIKETNGPRVKPEGIPWPSLDADGKTIEGHFLLTNGDLRTLACMANGANAVEIVVPADVGAAAQLGVLATNVVTMALTPYQVAKAVHQLVQQGKAEATNKLSIAAIGRAVKMSRSNVSNHNRAIVQLAPDLAERWRDEPDVLTLPVIFDVIKASAGRGFPKDVEITDQIKEDVWELQRDWVEANIDNPPESGTDTPKEKKAKEPTIKVKDLEAFIDSALEALEKKSRMGAERKKALRRAYADVWAGIQKLAGIVVE